MNYSAILKMKVSLTAWIIFLFLILVGQTQAEQLKANNSENTDAVENAWQLDTVTVTAEKREENIQDVETSVTSISDIQIEDAGITSTEDFILHVPNLHIGKIAEHGGVSLFNLRGVSGQAFAGSTGTAFYIDGAYYAGGMDTELLDIERIEVLRGPQGTLYGRNTQAGVINIVTKQPGDTREGSLTAGYDNDGGWDYRLTLGTPLIQNKLSFRLAGHYSVSDGYIDNLYTGSDDSNAREDINGRTSLKWTPTDRLEVLFSADALKFSDGYGEYLPLSELYDHPHDLSYDFEGSSDQEANGQILKVIYDFSKITLTSITTHRDWNADEWNDLDFTPADDMVSNYYHESEGYSQEFRLSSDKGQGPVTWLTGAYFFSEDYTADYLTQYHQGYPAWGLPAFENRKYSLTESTGYAFFGQATYTFFDRLDLTAGLRYDYEEKDFTYDEGYDLDLSAYGMSPFSMTAGDDYSQWLPKGVIGFRWNEDMMTYFSVAKGYKSGGFNAYSSSTAGEPYDQEYSWTYETGLKSSWLNNRLNINLSVFYIQWKDNQVTQQMSPSEISITNAGETTSKGGELEVNYRPFPGLSIVAGFGYTDATFDEYTDIEYDASTSVPIGTVSYNGNKVPHAPEYTYNLAATYRHSAGFFGRVEFLGVGPFYHDSANEYKEPAYELVNARIGYEWSRFEIYLWAKNIFDTAYATRAFDNGTEWVGRAGAPRTFGIEAKAKF